MELNTINKKWIIIVMLVVIPSIFSIQSCTSSNNKSKKVANDFLKAVQLHESLSDLASSDLLVSLSRGGILFNLISWEFVNEKKSPPKKEKIDLAESKYNKESEILCKALNVPTAEDLPDNFMDYFKSYNAWRDYNIQNKKAFEENGELYFYSDIPQVEYLLDITATNKLGMELKNKYILVTEKNDDNWEVTEFYQR